MVPGAGIEPARLAAGDFESPASTNFTTRAGRVKRNYGIALDSHWRRVDLIAPLCSRSFPMCAPHFVQSFRRCVPLRTSGFLLYGVFTVVFSRNPVCNQGSGCPACGQKLRCAFGFGLEADRFLHPGGTLAAQREGATTPALG